MNSENHELLADIIYQIGLNEKTDDKRRCLEKALMLYEYCNLRYKTYSFERESKINMIKRVFVRPIRSERIPAITRPEAFPTAIKATTTHAI